MAGQTTLVADQRASGGQWDLLRTFTFAAGGANRVVIGNDGTTDMVVADAVRFEYMP